MGSHMVKAMATIQSQIRSTVGFLNRMRAQRITR